MTVHAGGRSTRCLRCCRHFDRQDTRPQQHDDRRGRVFVIPQSYARKMAHHYSVKPGSTSMCQYCDQLIVRRTPFGRPRLYCKRSCRQRAYERRKQIGVRGASYKPLPPPESRVVYRMKSNRHPAWLKGWVSITTGKGHAVVPGPVQDGRFFRTLCGLQVMVLNTRFRTDEPAVCETCCKLLHRHPPQRILPDLADALALESRLVELESQLRMNLYIEPLIAPVIRPNVPLRSSA